MLIEYTVKDVVDKARKALVILRAADAAYAVERLAYRESVKQADLAAERRHKESFDATINQRAMELLAENKEKRSKFMGTFCTDELTMAMAVAEAKSTTYMLGRLRFELPSYLLIGIDYPNTAGIHLLDSLIEAAEKLPDDQKVVVTEQEFNILQLGASDE